MSKKVIAKSIEEDQSTQKIWLYYRKKCQQNGLVPSALIKVQLQQAVSLGVLQHLHISQPLGPNQARCLIQSLQQLKYKHLKELHLLKAQFGDEGVRIISKYLNQQNILQKLDLLDNMITPLGCQFLGKTINSNNHIQIQQLRLDNNNFGTQGIKFLAQGLKTYTNLQLLSLKYCNIDQDGTKYIQQIIANIKSKLNTLDLQGNPFQNKGVYQILRAIKNCGQNLQTININDARMNLLDYKFQDQTSIQYKIKDQITNIIKHNILLSNFQFDFNLIHDEIAEMILKEVQDANNIKNMIFPNNVRYQLRDSLDTIIRNRNKKKGKKANKKK